MNREKLLSLKLTADKNVKLISDDVIKRTCIQENLLDNLSESEKSSNIKAVILNEYNWVAVAFHGKEVISGNDSEVLVSVDNARMTIKKKLKNGFYIGGEYKYYKSILNKQNNRNLFSNKDFEEEITMSEDFKPKQKQGNAFTNNGFSNTGFSNTGFSSTFGGEFGKKLDPKDEEQNIKEPVEVKEGTEEVKEGTGESFNFGSKTSGLTSELKTETAGLNDSQAFFYENIRIGGYITSNIPLVSLALRRVAKTENGSKAFILSEQGQKNPKTVEANQNLKSLGKSQITGVDGKLERYTIPSEHKVFEYEIYLRQNRPTMSHVILECKNGSDVIAMENIRSIRDGKFTPEVKEGTVIKIIPKKPFENILKAIGTLKEKSSRCMQVPCTLTNESRESTDKQGNTITRFKVGIASEVGSPRKQIIDEKNYFPVKYFDFITVNKAMSEEDFESAKATLSFMLDKFPTERLMNLTSEFKGLIKYDEGTEIKEVKVKKDGVEKLEKQEVVELSNREFIGIETKSDLENLLTSKIQGKDCFHRRELRRIDLVKLVKTDKSSKKETIQCAPKDFAQNLDILRGKSPLFSECRLNSQFADILSVYGDEENPVAGNGVLTVRFLVQLAELTKKSKTKSGEEVKSAAQSYQEKLLRARKLATRADIIDEQSFNSGVKGEVSKVGGTEFTASSFDVYKKAFSGLDFRK